jgi:hypothetical protein
MTTVPAVKDAVGARRSACKTASGQSVLQITDNRSFCCPPNLDRRTWLVAAIRTIAIVVVDLHKRAKSCQLWLLATAKQATRGTARTWLKSMVSEPSKQVNFPFFGVYLAVLSGLAPRIRVDAALRHAAEITSSSTACSRPDILPIRQYIFQVLRKSRLGRAGPECMNSSAKWRAVTAVTVERHDK